MQSYNLNRNFTCSANKIDKSIHVSKPSLLFAKQEKPYHANNSIDYSISNKARPALIKSKFIKNLCMKIISNNVNKSEKTLHVADETPHFEAVKVIPILKMTDKLPTNRDRIQSPNATLRRKESPEYSSKHNQSLFVSTTSTQNQSFIVLASKLDCIDEELLPEYEPKPSPSKSSINLQDKKLSLLQKKYSLPKSPFLKSVSAKSIFGRRNFSNKKRHSILGMQGAQRITNYNFNVDLSYNKRKISDDFTYAFTQEKYLQVLHIFPQGHEREDLFSTLQ